MAQPLTEKPPGWDEAINNLVTEDDEPLEDMTEVMREIATEWNEAIQNQVTEDDEPVDNLFSAKQQRLLARTLYSSWTPPPSEEQPEEKRKFLAEVNVGVFSSPDHPPLVRAQMAQIVVRTPAGSPPREEWLRRIANVGTLTVPEL